MTLTITAFGLIDEGKSIQRNTANIGDNLYVTGNIGDSALGLRVAKNEVHYELSPKSRARLVERYRSPTPRVEIGMSLPGYATSAIDISDGLLADVGHIAKESGVQIRIQAQRVPVSAIAQRLLRTDPGLMDLILGGGDDYELAFTAPTNKHRKIVDLSNKAGVRITAIGDVLATRDCSPGIDLRGQKNEIIKSPYSGYSHF